MRQVLLAAVMIVFCGGWGLAENAGELRLKVTGPDGNGMRCRVLLQNSAKDLRRELETPDGTITVRGLPQGMYLLEVRAVGLQKYSERLNLDSAMPMRREIRLTLAVVSLTVDVSGNNDELIEHESATRSERLDSQTLESRTHPSLGRGIADAVAAQPGWLMEANGVLHPRGSEYQVQYMVDGVPLTDNRSATFSASEDDSQVQSVTVWTGSYPAEMGRKLGGVVEVETKRDPRRGLHGEVGVSGGSFQSGDADAEMQFGWKTSTLSWGAEGGETARYLDPPTLQNFTNRGTVGSFATRFEHELGERDMFGIGVRHQVLRFLVPNEIAQEDAGQRIARSTLETSALGSYRHIFSENALVDVRGMYRDLTAGMNSNEFAIPIAPSQDRGFREGYLKASVSLHQSRNEWKAGVEFDRTDITEQFRYSITDPLQFDPGTVSSLSFADKATGAEVGAFVQDAFHVGTWAVSAGLRWDRYKLLVKENAFSPRVGVSKYFKKLDLSIYGSYDRTFQTPAIENLLLASSPDIAVGSTDRLRLPVRPSPGNFYEVGVTKALAKKVRLNANYYLRNMNEFADDDLLLNTGVSFPIAFSSAKIYGAEAKLEIPRWNRFSGFVSYSYMVGRGSLPVTGGLLLGTDAVAQAALSGSFRISQDQRNTVNARFRFEASKRVWVAAGTWFGSGLPTELDSEEGRDAIAGIDTAILNRVDFERERLKPSYSIDLSGGVSLLKKEKRQVRVQVDLRNVTNHLNVINFAGLFSGTAVGVPRAAHVSVKAEF